MRCSRHAWTGPAAERQAAGDGATAPAPASRTRGPRRRRSIFRSSACSFLFLIGSRPCISPPHPTLCLRPMPMRADGSIRARWHILMWMRPGPHLRAPGPTHVPCACRARAPRWTDPMTPRPAHMSRASSTCPQAPLTSHKASCLLHLAFAT